MKHPFLVLLSIGFAHAVPVISTTDWMPACDGANIEIVSEGSRILSVQASAYHSVAIFNWTIHYMDGRPLSAEFREFVRGRISDGEKAGEFSGANPIRRLVTCKWEDGKVQLDDKELEKDLNEILTKVSAARRKPESVPE
jgi:hypothetical protein